MAVAVRLRNHRLFFRLNTSARPDAPAAPPPSAIELYRSSEKKVSTSLCEISVRRIPAQVNPEKAPWSIFHHGFPGTSLEFYRQAALLCAERNVLLVDGPWHALSEGADGFNHAPYWYVQLLHEVLEAEGLNSPKISADLIGHSVGSLICLEYLATAVAKGWNTPKYRMVGLLSALGQHVRPIQLPGWHGYLPSKKKGEVYWPIDNHLPRFAGATLVRLFGGEKDIVKAHDVLFSPGWRTNGEIQGWLTENAKYQLTPNKKGFSKKAAKLIVGTARAEWGIYAKGRHYGIDVLEQLGLLHGSPTPHRVLSTFVSLWKEIGAHFRFVVPESDKVYLPVGQTEFAQLLGSAGADVSLKTVAGGSHMAPVEQPGDVLANLAA